VSRVAGRCPLPFRLARGAEAEAPLGEGLVPIGFFFRAISLVADLDIFVAG
jgi:hypothetical protein